MFEWLGATVFRHRWWTLLSTGLFLAFASYLLVRGGPLTSGSIHGLESEKAQLLVEEVLGHPMDTTFIAVFRDPKQEASDAVFTAEMNAALEPLRKDSRVLQVVTPAEAPPFLTAGMVNVPARAALAMITLKGDMKTALQIYPEVRQGLRSDTLEIACTGRLPVASDLDRTLESDLFRAELISLPLALIVLLLVFRTLTAAVLPAGVGALAVIGGIGIVLGLSHHTDIAQYTINVCSLIGLGVAIDYSLFTVSRYREELAAGHDYRTALIRAVATAGRVVAFAGLAVGTGLSGLLFFEGSYLRAMGLGGAIVVGLAAIFALTFLPALLAVLGPKIHAGRLPFGKKEKAGEGAWHRLATWVMHRPLRALVPTLGVLAFMGIPFFHLQLATADVRVLPPRVESRHGYDLLRDNFPAQAETRHVVAVQFPDVGVDQPVLTREHVGALYDFTKRVAALPNVRKVEGILPTESLQMTREQAQDMLTHPPPKYAPIVEMSKKLTIGSHIALLYVLTAQTPDSLESRTVVRTIRQDRAIADGTLVVGGETANDLDSTAYMMERAPRAIGFVVTVTLVILFLLLGSVVLPLKAVVMNVLSMVGSFGALVWVFQDGHLFIHDPRPIEPTLPVLLFCMLFGLSMDYEVLMLSRMKESYERTRDNTHAVAEGLEKTAGLITSAAAIMVSVFGAFALARVVLIQAVGFGMALAVALDATLVRVLLVPATMRLFGDINWWAPAPLVRLRHFLGLDHVHEPEPEVARRADHVE